MEKPLRGRKKSPPVFLFNGTKVFVFEDMEEATRRAAEEFLRTSRNAIKRRGAMRVALSGGKTPEGLYRLLSGDPFRGNVDWGRVHLFWGDERCVPPGDRESNFHLARLLLLKKLKVPKGNVHRIKGEKGEASAGEYEKEIKKAFNLKGGELPAFDLTLLGMGGDGHIASLFPGSPVLKEDKKIAVAVHVKKAPKLRITLTPPVILNSRKTIVLVGGREKARALFLALKEDEGEGKIPARILKRSKAVLWFVDRSVASLLIK